jgi:hypothetical protein
VAGEQSHRIHGAVEYQFQTEVSCELLPEVKESRKILAEEIEIYVLVTSYESAFADGSQQGAEINPMTNPGLFKTTGGGMERGEALGLGGMLGHLWKTDYPVAQGSGIRS